MNNEIWAAVIAVGGSAFLALIPALVVVGKLLQRVDTLERDVNCAWRTIRELKQEEQE